MKLKYKLQSKTSTIKTPYFNKTSYYKNNHEIDYSFHTFSSHICSDSKKNKTGFNWTKSTVEQPFLSNFKIGKISQ